MTLEHKLRIAVSGLHGEERMKAMITLRQKPEKIMQCLRERRTYFRKRILGVNNKLKHPIDFSCMLSPEQYLELRDKARAANISISAYTRLKLFSEGAARNADRRSFSSSSSKVV